MSKELDIINNPIKNKILTIRGMQVMLDRDLAELYEVETKNLNKAVKRNIERFPRDFMFQLNEKEFNDLRFQIGTSSLEKHGGRRYFPFVFTEHGVTALSGVLKNKKAIEVNLKIIRAFVSMRKFIYQNKEIFFRLDSIERKQLKTDEKIDEIFDYMQLAPSQGIFFDNEVFDAFKFISDLIKKAKHRVVLIDNYVDENTLCFFTKTNVEVLVLTKNISSKEIAKFKVQYSNVDFKEFDKSHDRFLIIDDEVYLFGASLKDAGKKWFGFFKVHDVGVLKKIRSYF